MEKTIKYRLFVWFSSLTDIPIPVYGIEDEEVWALEEGVAWRTS